MSVPRGRDEQGMRVKSELRIAIESIADAAVARSLALRSGLALGLDERSAAEIALATSELATNIIKYAGVGELLICAEADALVVTALDRGPGPPSEAELFGDRISRGTPLPPDHAIREGRGTGGAALRRLCDSVEIEARVGGGSLIRCRKHKRRSRRSFGADGPR